MNEQASDVYCQRERENEREGKRASGRGREKEKERRKMIVHFYLTPCPREKADETKTDPK